MSSISVTALIVNMLTSISDVNVSLKPLLIYELNLYVPTSLVVTDTSPRNDPIGGNGLN